MATAIANSFAAARSETHHYFGAVAIAFCTRFVAAARARHEERRMLNTVHELDHAGVQADVEAACRMQRD